MRYAIRTPGGDLFDFDAMDMNPGTRLLLPEGMIPDGQHLRPMELYILGLLLFFEERCGEGTAVSSTLLDRFCLDWWRTEGLRNYKQNTPWFWWLVRTAIIGWPSAMTQFRISIRRLARFQLLHAELLDISSGQLEMCTRSAPTLELVS